jgi:hypothetical protein
MSTWVEIAASGGEGAKDGSRRTLAEYRESGATNWPKLGIGGGAHSFAQRLSRARLLYARRREALFNWLALSLAMVLVMATPSLPV